MPQEKRSTSPPGTSPEAGRHTIPYVTKLQSFGIFLVVLGHADPLASHGASPPYMAWLHGFIYSFHMPLFMFISGLLFVASNNKKGIAYKEFLAKKIKRLLLPYFIISTLAFIPKSIVSGFAERSVSLSLDGYLNGLIYPFENPIIFFWFLPTLFLIFMIAPFLGRCLFMGSLPIQIAVAIFCVWLHFQHVDFELFGFGTALGFLVYFYLGCLAMRYQEKLRLIKQPGFCIASLAVLLFLNVALAFGLASPFMKFMTASAGIMFSLSLAHSLAGMKFNIFRPIEGFSYQIYLLSWFASTFFRIFFQMGMYGYTAAFLLRLLGGLLIPVWVAILVKRRAPSLGFVIGL